MSPADGTLLWKSEWRGDGIVQPAMLDGGELLIGSGSGMDQVGTRRLAVEKGNGGWVVTERWTSNGLKPYFNDLVVHKGYAFGFDGNILSCIDLHDGQRKWKGGRYGHGQLVLLPEQDMLLVVTAGMLLFARNLLSGRLGRAFLAIRDNERAAAAMGVNLARYKTIAFAISALYTGLAGALSAFIVGFLDPQEFSFFLSIQFITIIILGGLASLLGSILGAGFLIILPEMLAGLDVWQALVYGAIMVLTIIFMPFGLSGTIRRYGYRWFGLGVEPIVPRRLGH